MDPMFQLILGGTHNEYVYGADEAFDTAKRLAGPNARFVREGVLIGYEGDHRRVQIISLDRQQAERVRAEIEADRRAISPVRRSPE